MTSVNYRNLFLLCMLSSLLLSCTREYSCTDPEIRLAFVGFSNADIDTIVIRKYAANGNYQAVLDTFTITNPVDAEYMISGDTVTLFPANATKGIYAGFDWQVLIPAANRTVFISNIVSEHRKGKCGTGLFSMDKLGCACTNNVFSASLNNTNVNFVNLTFGPPTLYLKN